MWLLLATFIVAVSLISERLAEAADNCFTRLSQAPLPFEIYIGAGVGRSGTYLQSVGSAYGLSEEAQLFLNYPGEIQVIELCDGNFAAIWLEQNYGRAPVYLLGRIFNRHGKALSGDFRITETDELQGPHSVARLNENKFIVTWYSERARKGLIRARIFSSSGKSLGRSFTIPLSPDLPGHFSVYQLPDGGFALSWIARLDMSAHWRLYKENGIPKGQSVLIAEGSPKKRVPYLYITSDGSISAFLAPFDWLPELPIVELGRRYSSSGAALSPELDSEEAKHLPGYQEVVEFLASQVMQSLEHTLREFRQKTAMGFQLCTMPVLRGYQMKKVTQDRRKKELFTLACRQRRENCKPMQFNEKEVEECAASD